MLKAFAKKVFTILVVLEWLVAGVVGLEVFERGRAYIAERAYEDYFDAQNRKVYRMVPAEELAAARNQFDLGGERQAALAAAAPPPEAEAVQPARDDDIRLTLAGEMVAWFTPDGHSIESHGEPLIERDLLAHIEDLPHAHGLWNVILKRIPSLEEPVSFELYLQKGMRRLYRIELIPHRNSEGGLEKVELHAYHESHTLSDAERHIGGQAPPPDSNWRIYSYAYKKNYHRPDNMVMTNNYGFRDEDVTVPKPPGVYRIVCVGGSTTEEGNTTEATYPNIVERKLQERFGTSQIDVINCGLSGMNTYSQRERIEDYLALEPDLILWYGPVNDICHMYFQRWLAQIEPWQKTLRQSKFLNRYFNRLLFIPDEDLIEYLEETTYRNLAAMAYAAKQRGTAMAIASFAYPDLRLWDIRARNYYNVNLREVWHSEGLITFETYCHIMRLHNRRIQRFCEDRDLYYIPLAENFHAGPDHFFDICHMTPVGLELKTNIITAHLVPYLLEHSPFRLASE